MVQAPWITRAGGIFAALVVGFVVVAAFVVAPFVAANPQAALGVQVGAAVLVGGGALIGLRAAREREGGIEGMLAATAPWLPGVLAAAIVALFLLGQSAATA